MIGRWRGGSEVVFAARSTRPGVSPGDRLAGLVVHGAVRLVLPRSRYPWAGTDLGVFGRHVLAALAVDPSPAGNVFVRIARLGLPAAIVPVAKEPRRHGRSQWTLAARVRLARAMLAEACGRPPSASPAPAIGGRLGWAASRCCRIGT
jgi:hypothetical protein